MNGFESLSGDTKAATPNGPGPNYSASSQVVRCAKAEALLKTGGGGEDPMRWVRMVIVEIHRIAQREVDRDNPGEV